MKCSPHLNLVAHLGDALLPSSRVSSARMTPRGIATWITISKGTPCSAAAAIARDKFESMIGLPRVQSRRRTWTRARRAESDPTTI